MYVFVFVYNLFVGHAFPLLANAYNIAALKTLFYTFDVHFDTSTVYTIGV